MPGRIYERFTTKTLPLPGSIGAAFGVSIEYAATMPPAHQAMPVTAE